MVSYPKLSQVKVAKVDVPDVIKEPEVDVNHELDKQDEEEAKQP